MEALLWIAGAAWLIYATSAKARKRRHARHRARLREKAHFNRWIP